MMLPRSLPITALVTGTVLLVACDPASDPASTVLSGGLDVHTVAPHGAGTTPGMPGYMFRAAETPSARRNYVSTTPPNTCEDGMGVAASVFEIPVPMEPLRQR